MQPHIEPLGDSALAIHLGTEIDEPTRVRVRNGTAALEAAALPGVVDVVPAFTTITLHWRLNEATFEIIAPLVVAALATVSVTEVSGERLIRIPVAYGGVFGPDLEAVAAHAAISQQDVVARHCAREYRVYMLGFLPGFAYLGGLDASISVPRLDAPRTRVPAGSVGIAGVQTGIYPLESPGGWRLIGRSPCRLFDPMRDPPALLRSGDRIRFDAIEHDIFDAAEMVISEPRA